MSSHTISFTTDQHGNRKAVCACGWANSHPIDRFVDEDATEHLAKKDQRMP